MNESIRPRENLVLTLICATCGNQFGKWRPQCPACGTRTPQPKATFNPPRVTKRQVLGEAMRQSKTACIFCRARGAKERCKHCNELIHRTCIALHEPECIKFQKDVEVEVARLAQNSPFGNHKGETS